MIFLQRMLYSLGVKMSELSDSVQKKRIELQRLRRVKAVTDIVESQVSLCEIYTHECLRKYVIGY